MKSAMLYDLGAWVLNVECPRRLDREKRWQLYVRYVNVNLKGKDITELREQLEMNTAEMTLWSEKKLHMLRVEGTYNYSRITWENLGRNCDVWKGTRFYALVKSDSKICILQICLN